MEITINDKVIELNFGILFARKMNALHHIDQEGIEVGTGVENALVGAYSQDPVMLSEIIYNAAWQNSKRPTQADVDKWLETEADIDKLSADIMQSLQESNLTKAKAKKFLEALQQK